MYKAGNMRWIWGLLILFATPIGMAAESTFQTDIKRIKWLQQRDKTSLIALDKLGEELLNRYQQPKEQGEIYYYLAHQHAQGGLVLPQKVISYADKALEYPVTADQKMRLYVYRGDALHILNLKTSFQERRRKAVGSYLQGLKDLKAFQLPDAPPALPNQPPFMVGLGSSEEDRRKQEEEQRKYEEARERAEFTRQMMMHRSVLQGQIVGMYGRKPVATKELKELATGILGEGKEFDRLMTAVDEKVAKLPPEDRQDESPVEAVTPAMPSKYLYLCLALGAGAVIAAALLLIVRRGRSNRRAGPSATQKT